MLVRNYGLFWNRESVFWGRPHVAGHLKGRPSTAVTREPVDFRDQQGVYVLYDSGFDMIYVGQAGSNDQFRLFDRLRQHTKDALADRWTKFSWFGVRAVNANGTLHAENAAAHPLLSDVLNHIEAILIYAAEPPHNRQGGRFGEDVEQYLQYRDEEQLGPEFEDMVRDLWRSRQDASGRGVH
ncbi:MAG TPA: GIY-YIG nuclease family protein [Candidatus Acidoferrum sp.]|nr:GIY-YIG nuclease family protein [Candidatus Acidoferrum sp.]